MNNLKFEELKLKVVFRLTSESAKVVNGFLFLFLLSASFAHLHGF